MKTSRVVALMALTALAVALAGCSDEPKSTELTGDQKYQLEMARIKQGTPNVQYQVPPSVVSNEYVRQEDVSYSEQRSVQSDLDASNSNPNGDNGMSTGSAVGLGLLGGVVTGYMAASLLDDGWSSGYDSSGNLSYRNSRNEIVSESAFQSHKKQHPVKRAISKSNLKERLKAFKARAKVAGKTVAKAGKASLQGAKVIGGKAVVKGKAAVKVAAVVAKPLAARVAAKATPLVIKAKEATTVVARKAIVVAKKAKKKRKKKKGK